MRGPPVCLRDLTAEEASAVKALAHSRTAPAQRVERARLVWRASRGETPPTIAAALGVSAETVRRRIRRFNAEGLAALEDRYRSGRPATYSADAVPQRWPARAIWICPSRRGRSTGLPPTCLSTRGSPCGAAELTRSCSGRACAGAGTRAGSASGSIPSSRKKGADRDALHCAARGQLSRLPRRDGPAQRQELPGPGLGAATPATGGPGAAGD